MKMYVFWYACTVERIQLKGTCTVSPQVTFNCPEKNFKFMFQKYEACKKYNTNQMINFTLKKKTKKNDQHTQG